MEDEILDKLYEIELETGEVITSVIENMKKWEKLELTSLYKNVKREGVVIELVQNRGVVPTTGASSGSSMP